MKCRKEKTAEKYSLIFHEGYGHAPYALSFAVQTEAFALLLRIAYVVYSRSFCNHSFKFVENGMAADQAEMPMAETVRTYCSRAPQKIRNMFFSFVSSILTNKFWDYNLICS